MHTEFDLDEVFIERSHPSRRFMLDGKSNLLVYVDGNKNDMKVVAITDKGAELISDIKNIPLGKTFRLTVVYLSTYVEVYIDGKLNATHLLKGIPRGNEVDFWPPPDTVSSIVKVGTFYYWPRALSATEIQTLLPLSAADFFIQKT